MQQLFEISEEHVTLRTIVSFICMSLFLDMISSSRSVHKKHSRIHYGHKQDILLEELCNCQFSQLLRSSILTPCVFRLLGVVDMEIGACRIFNFTVCTTSLAPAQKTPDSNREIRIVSGCCRRSSGRSPVVRFPQGDWLQVYLQ